MERSLLSGNYHIAGMDMDCSPIPKSSEYCSGQLKATARDSIVDRIKNDTTTVSHGKRSSILGAGNTERTSPETATRVTPS